MKATWDKLENNWMQFEVEVEADRLAKSIDAAFRNLNQRVTVPGFRRGKAPRALFERNYGKDSLVQEAVEQLLPRAYAEAVVEGRVDPIDQPEVEIVQVEDGKEFVFKGKVQVMPEVKLGKISGFGIEKPSGEVTAAQIDEQLNNLRDRTATLVTDESEEVKQGSFAMIDFEGFVDNEPFEGGKAENYTLEVGSGSFIPGFEEQLVGAKVGESSEVKVSFPEEYHAEQLAGKEALFKVTVREVKRKELPELNDEFAAEASRFQTLQELRADIENRLQETSKQNAETDFQNKIIDAIAEEAEVEVPEVLVQRRVHDMIHDFEHSLANQGYSLDLWYQATGKTHDDLHTEFGPQARKAAKNDLVIGAIGRQAEIRVTDADIEAEFDKMQATYSDQAKELQKLRKNSDYRARLREGLQTQKTLEHIVNLNTAPQG
jgi:trigger factor